MRQKSKTTETITKNGSFTYTYGEILNYESEEMERNTDVNNEMIITSLLEHSVNQK